MIFQKIKNLFKSDETMIERQKLPHEICPDVLNWEKGDRIYLNKLIDDETGENYRIRDYKFTFLSLDESYVYILRETYIDWSKVSPRFDCLNDFAFRETYIDWPKDDVYTHLVNKILKIPIKHLNLIDNATLRLKNERAESKKKDENDKKKYEDTLNYIKANDFYMQFLKEYKKLNEDK